MVEYEFLRAIGDLITSFRHFPFPAVIVDGEFRPYWSNNLARSTFAHITTREGLAQVLAEYDLAELRSQVNGSGGCLLGDTPPLSGMQLNISPVVREGEHIGMLLVLLETRSPPLDGALPHAAGEAAHTLARGIRQAVGDIFSVMDVAAMKADQVEMSWIKPNLSQISYYGYRALRIADNVAEYAYLVNGGSLQPEATDLVQMLSTLAHPLGELAHGAGATLAVELPELSVPVCADSARLELALLNVLHNSLYFTRPDNRVLLRLGVRGGMVELLVRDQGRGMPEQVRRQACTPYFSHNYGTGQRTPGLGLTLARMICEAHGGRLLLESEEGKGTSVTLQLPEGVFNTPLRLGQGNHPSQLQDRFSALYTVLGDLPASPFIE